MHTSKESHGTYDLFSGQIKSVAHEEAVIYFTQIRKPFQNLRQIIQRLSGFIILFQNQKFLKSETVLAYELGKPLLEETLEELRTMKVPQIAEKHFQSLKHAAYYLYEFYQIKRDFKSQTLQPHDESLVLLEKAYESLKSASGFSFGLEMVSLDSSCACGHH